jgi:type II secretory pathway component PulC
MTMRVGISWLAPMLFGLGATLMAMVAELGSPAWIKPRPRPVLALPQDPVPTLDLDRLAALTGVASKSRESNVPVATQPTSLHLRARGTMMGQFVDWVAIEDLDTGKMRSYAVGDEVQSATIVAITRTLVTLRELNKTTYLEVSSLGRVAVTPPRPPLEVSKGRFEISRQEVVHELSDLDAIATTARVVPSTHGFKIFAIRAGSLVSRLGIQNGDKLTKVNGVALDSVDAVLNQMTRLSMATHIELELERDGAPLTQTYELR